MAIDSPKNDFAEKHRFLTYADEPDTVYDGSKIMDGSVTTDKLADYAVTTDKIDDESITLSKMDADVLNLLEGNVKGFDTVSDMQSATLEAGEICHTNGFHTSGGGGAAFYKITATGTANGMDVLACGDVFANLIITESYVTPEMFGAWGDGVHDDSDSLQCAFDNCDNIRLIGEYAISEPIDVKGHVSGESGCLVTAYDKATRMTALFVHAGALLIENVTFDCLCSVTYAESDYSSLYNVAISSTDTSYKLVVKNCVFNNVYTSALNFCMSHGEITIDGCNFNPGVGNASIADYIRLATSNGDYVFAVRNCTFTGLFKSIGNYCGVYMATCNDRKEIIIENNVFDGLSRYGNHRLAAVDCYGLVYNVKIKNNQITNCAWNAIRLHTCSGSEVSGNYITMDATRERLSEYAVLVSNALIDNQAFDFDSIVIKDNYIECKGTYQQQFGIEVYTSNNGTKIGKCEIINNVICGTFIRSVVIYPHADLFIISNNEFSNGIDYGIRIEDEDYTNVRVIISENSIHSNTPIYYRDTGSGNVEIFSNILKSITGYCVNASNTPAIIIGNFISGYVGVLGGGYVGFNNLYDLTGTVKITAATKTFMNYYNGNVV